MPETPQTSEPPARKRRSKFAAGTMPPPMEAKPAAEEVEELPQELLKAEPPEIPPSRATQEALDDVRAHVEDRIEEDKEWEAKREAAGAAAEAAEERKRIVESRGVGLDQAHQELQAAAEKKRLLEIQNGVEIAKLREKLATKAMHADLAHQAVDRLIAEDESIPDMTEHAEPIRKEAPSRLARLKNWLLGRK